jgi:hypothetical protein
VELAIIIVLAYEEGPVSVVITVALGSPWPAMVALVTLGGAGWPIAVRQVTRCQRVENRGRRRS